VPDCLPEPTPEDLEAVAQRRRERTEACRAALQASYELAVDPEGVLAPEERAAKAAELRSQRMREMSIRSAAVRRKRRLDSLRAEYERYARREAGQ
jgi:hypothetical protein